MYNGITIVCGKNKTGVDQKHAVVISKNAAKNSVTRNTLKRTIRKALGAMNMHCDEFVVLYNKHQNTKKEVEKTFKHLSEKIKKIKR